jgi:excisionase family DNA binding protein
VGEGRTDEPATTQRRVPVAEAAKALGISEGAVRMRVKRGTLPSTREGGRLYVLLNTEPTPDPERTHDRTSELIAALREQLQAERQAHAEARRLLMAALERIPAIEAPASTEKRESDLTVSPDPERGTTPGDRERPAQRPWWRRVFGG